MSTLPDIAGEIELSPYALTQMGDPTAFDRALSSRIQKLKLTAAAPLFEASTPEELLNIIAVETDSYRRNDSLHRALDWSASIIKPLERFFSAIDVGISAHPELAGIVWGCIRFILTLLRSHSKYIDMIVTTLTNISRRLHFYEDYALVLYKTSGSVQQALAHVYGAILDFCQEVHSVFYNPSSGKPRGTMATFTISINPWSDARMHRIVDELDRIQASLIEEIQHADRMTNRDGRVRLNEHFMNFKRWIHGVEACILRGQDTQAQANYESNERRFRELIASIPHTECGHIQEESCAKVKNDSCCGRWLLLHPKYTSWVINDDGEHMLRIVGQPGAGKTVLTSLVVKDLLRHQKCQSARNVAVSFFYCRYNDPTRTQPLAMLAPYTPATPDEGALLAHLGRTVVCVGSGFQHFKLVYVVIDALDECPADTLELFLPHLTRLNLRLLLVSRPMPLLSLSVPIIQITETDIASDIHRYVQRRVHHPEEQEAALHISNPALRKEVVDALVKNADGMFLWVDLQILHLCEQRTDHDIKVALSSLPWGLSASFHRSLEQAYDLLGPRRTRVRRVFTWLLSYGGPVPLDLLQQAIAVEEMDGVWDTSKLVTDPTSLVDDCANLVKLTHEGVQFVHASVRDFLLQDNELDTLAMRYFACSSIQQEHCDVFFTCCKVSRLLDRLRDSSSYTPLIWYIENVSLTHIRYVDEISDPSDALFTFKRMLRLRKISPFHSHFKKFISFGPEADLALITHMCAYLACPRILSHQLWSGEGSISHLDSGGRTPLHYATGFLYPPVQFVIASPECARLLLEKGADAGAMDNQELTPLHYVAMRPPLAAECDTDIRLPQMLLEHGADSNAQNRQSVRPVHLATFTDCMNQPLLKLLVQYGANINPGDFNGDTPLHLLFQKRWVSGVDTNFLLASGADPNLANHAGLTPLQTLLTRPRARSSHERDLVQRVVDILVDWGALVQHVLTEPAVSATIRRNWGNDKRMMHTLLAFDEKRMEEKILHKPPGMQAYLHSSCPTWHHGSFYSRFSIHPHSSAKPFLP